MKKDDLDTTSLVCFAAGNVLHTAVRVLVVAGQILVDYKFGSGLSQAALETIKLIYYSGVTWERLVDCVSEGIYTVGFLSWLGGSLLSVMTKTGYEISLTSEKLNIISSVLGVAGCFAFFVSFWANPATLPIILVVGAWAKCVSSGFWVAANSQPDQKLIDDLDQNEYRQKSLKSYANFSIAQTSCALLVAVNLTLALVCPPVGTAAVAASVIVYSGMIACTISAVIFYCQHFHYKKKYSVVDLNTSIFFDNRSDFLGTDNSAISYV